WERPPIRSFGVRALGAVLSGVLLLLAAQALAATPEETGKPGVAVHPTLAVGFIANEGRLDPQVRYYGRGRGYAVYFTPGEVVLSFAPRSSTSRADHVALALHFVGGSPAAALDVRREGIAKVNDLTGSDPARWRSGLSTYHEVVYREVWPGIDVVFRQESGRLKYEFIVAPGARPDAIRLAYRGAEAVSLDAAGNLAIR